MKIISLEANNYRTLHDLTIIFSKDYCTISGKNNSGKSCIIRLLSNLFQPETISPFYISNQSFDYKEDKTQWLKNNTDPIEIIYKFELSKSDDLSLIRFIEKLTNSEINSSETELCLKTIISPGDILNYELYLSSKLLEADTTKEIITKLKNSNVLFLHNSTTSHEEIYYGRGRRRSFYEMFLSEDEQQQLDIASKTVQKKIRQLAKEHKKDLNNFLGKLSEKYDVEFSSLESSFTRRMPFSINLNDKTVEVPLSDWGSGTQNRTFVLMSILQANRIKTKDPIQERITPIVIVEEPESFLHPSAQAEFGKILRDLSVDLGIQIITTTHSPYILNQKNPKANILLSRNCTKKQILDTCIIDTSGDKWMAPFAEHLGASSHDFKDWYNLFSTDNSKVLLVEGETDKEYFEYIRSKSFGKEPLSDDIEIVAYGGKNAMTNTLLVKFVLSKFKKVFITYDLDASSEVVKALNRLNLNEFTDYIAVGINQPGKDAIEGLLPNRVLSAVMSNETDLIMSLGSTDSSIRKEAKNKLKKLYLEEFKKHDNYSDKELNELFKIITIVNKKFV